MASTPPKTLKGRVSVGSSVSTITDTSSSWYGNPISWNLTLSVQPTNTSYAGPRNDFTYDGRDVKVGDWVADTTGLTLQLTSIISSSSTTVVAVGEDVGLYNVYNDNSSTGNGCISEGNCLVFDDHDGLAVITPYYSGYLADTFSQNIFSRFNYTVEIQSGSSGGAVALASSVLNVSTVNQLASGSSIEFTLQTGSNFYLTSLTTNEPMTVQCHSTSQYADTNPYSFKSITGFLSDDGSFSSGGNTYFGPKNILLQNSEDQQSMNSYWKIINSGTDSISPQLNITILSFNSVVSQNVTVNADGSTTITPSN